MPRIPVGDFRPWLRLLVLLAGIAAVGYAAKSVSRRMSEAKLDARVASLHESAERAQWPHPPLVDLTGFPRPATSPGPEIGSWANGRVFDSSGVPIAGARVRAIGEFPEPESRQHPVLPAQDPTGRFSVFLGTPRGPWSIRVDPPYGRDDLEPLVVESVPLGLPSLPVQLGHLVLPRRDPSVPMPPAKVPFLVNDFGGRGPWGFARPADADDALSLAGWKLLPETQEGRKRADRWLVANFRTLLLQTPEEFDWTSLHPRAEPPTPPEPLEIRAQLRSAEGQPLRNPALWLDGFASGVALFGKTAGGTLAQEYELLAMPGDHRLVAAAAGHLPVAIDLAVPLSPQAPPISITLPCAAELAIEVETAEGALPPPLGVRIVSAEGCAVLALPDDGKLVVDRLPPTTLRFELVAPALYPPSASIPGPALETASASVVRTLVPGDKNPRVLLHFAPPPPARIVEGTTRPNAFVYRRGARLDEPSSYARADGDGRFRIAVRAGSRLFACDGEAPRLGVPFASTEVGESGDPRFGAACTLDVRVDGLGAREATVRLEAADDDGFAASGRTAQTTGGRVRFDDVAPGMRCRLVAIADDAYGEIDRALPDAGGAVSVELAVRRR
ncbi:MAG TPA: carboxypeptidase regulatory-like domain-containing protein [Planctomycetota bacterium]|nr:carboxypeptidase regulatory-like domain-containing protein [Planctomycetota bacterium]